MTQTLGRQDVLNILTLVILGVWVITIVVRLWMPWPEATVADKAMLAATGYWFAVQALKKNGNGAA